MINKDGTKFGQTTKVTNNPLNSTQGGYCPYCGAIIDRSQTGLQDDEMDSSLQEKRITKYFLTRMLKEAMEDQAFYSSPASNTLLSQSNIEEIFKRRP